VYANVLPNLSLASATALRTRSTAVGACTPAEAGVQECSCLVDWSARSLGDDSHANGFSQGFAYDLTESLANAERDEIGH
jgi:hypothetical protein